MELGLQDLLFMLIRGLIWALPLGIVALAAQLSAQFSAGIVMDSLGKYVAVILGGNVIQFFSAATLPVTMNTAETRMGVSKKVSRFVLPIYTIIDMIETAENVWSDSCVCAMVNKDI